MKSIRRGIVKVLPGKMAEAMEIHTRYVTIAEQLGAPPSKSYRSISGRDEDVHTIIYDTEWNSLAELEAFLEKLYVDSRMQEISIKWDEVVESHDHSLYTVLPRVLAVH
ncbi:hypothetical protein ACFLTP_09865 [Chloroflexota bacterium]